MNGAASNHQESTHFIHQRYQDTANIIFQQQQKVRQDEKRREQHSKSHHHSQFPGASANQHPEFNRYGNRGVVSKDTGAIAKFDDTSNNKPGQKPSVQTPSSPSVLSSGHSSVKSSHDQTDTTYHHRPRRKSKSKPVTSLESSV